MFNLEKESDKGTTKLKHLEILMHKGTCSLWPQREKLGPMSGSYKVGQNLASSVREKSYPPQEGGLPIIEPCFGL